MITTGKVILAINPNAIFTAPTDINLVDDIIWRDGTTPIVKADIIAKYNELKTDYDAKDTQEKELKNTYKRFYGSVHRKK